VIDAFRHNSWATVRLIELCRGLEPSLLAASAPGTYGPIGETLAHVVGWEEVLAAAVDGSAQRVPPPAFTSLDDLADRAGWLAERWESALAPGEPHAERLVQFGDRLVRVGTVLAQVVHHGNHHRAHVCTVLSTIDVTPPALDAWAWAAGGQAPASGV
jgi:uncharacterized damage-inducible protein DinB